MNNEEANQEFFRFLAEKNVTNCRICGCPIKRANVAWKDAKTVEGERFTIAAIRCTNCDMRVANWASWHANVQDWPNFVQFVLRDWDDD